MVRKPAPTDTPRRRNRATALGDLITDALDPVLQKRGFASRDLVTHWAAICPSPYETQTLPDRLAWPRGERGAEGAVLYLRCAEGRQMAVAQDSQRIASAINRYFGYLLIAGVRLSAAPFTPGSGPKDEGDAELDPRQRASVNAAVEGVGDDGLREALRGLGHGIAGRSGRRITRS